MLLPRLKECAWFESLFLVSEAFCLIDTVIINIQYYCNYCMLYLFFKYQYKLNDVYLSCHDSKVCIHRLSLFSVLVFSFASVVR